MPIEALDHYNICTADLDRARRFYSDAIGLRDGERPPFGRPGIHHQSFVVPDRNLVQVFFRDPDGAEIELIFSSGEAAAEIAAGRVAIDATGGRDTVRAP